MTFSGAKRPPFGESKGHLEEAGIQHLCTFDCCYYIRRSKPMIHSTDVWNDHSVVMMIHHDGTYVFCMPRLEDL